MPAFLAGALLRRLRRGRGFPDFVIQPYGDGEPYLLRWFLWRNKRISCGYLHNMKRDDEDRALHDHPWWSVSLVLAGGYVEVLPRDDGRLIRKYRGPGSIVFRRASARHRLELPPPEFDHGHIGAINGTEAVLLDAECWSLFITGPRVREWGFHCPRGWIHYLDFCNYEAGSSTVGNGVNGPLSIPGTRKPALFDA